MAYYKGRALEPDTPRARARARARGRPRPLVRVAIATAVVAVLAHVPWAGAWKRVAVLKDIRVEGLHYLDAERLCRIADLERGRDLFSVHCERARQRLLLHPRIERAEVTRLWPRGVRVRIVERLPVMLVEHGLPWEADSAGVLLAPLADGVVADVPMLAGISLDGIPEGARLDRPEVRRGLAWVRALSASELQLGGRVSEIDVSDSLLTGILLMSRTRVLASAWPPGLRTLSALRVVLADLERQGTVAREVDLRFRDQVVVRPAEMAWAAAGPAVAAPASETAAPPAPPGSDPKAPAAAGTQAKRRSS